MRDFIGESVQETSSLNLSLFSFQFCRNVHFSFNVEFSVKLSFQQNSRVKFSFSCLTWYNFCSWLPSNFTFLSWEASCLFEILIGWWRSEWRKLSIGYSFLPLQFGLPIRTFVWFWFYFLGGFLPVWNTYLLFKKRVTKPLCWLFFPAFRIWSRIRTEGPNNNFRQIVGGSFLVPYCLGLLLPFSLWSNQVPHVVSFIIWSRKIINNKRKNSIFFSPKVQLFVSFRRWIWLVQFNQFTSMRGIHSPAKNTSNHYYTSWNWSDGNKRLDGFIASTISDVNWKESEMGANSQ